MPEHLVSAVDRAIKGNPHAIKAWNVVRKAVMYDREVTLSEAQDFYEALECAEALPNRAMTELDDDLVIDLAQVD
jgi:hypothetical protein